MRTLSLKSRTFYKAKICDFIKMILTSAYFHLRNSSDSNSTVDPTQLRRKSNSLTYLSLYFWWIFLPPPQNEKYHHHSYIFFLLIGSFLVPLIPHVSRILLDVISFSLPFLATLAFLILLLDLLLCGTILCVKHIRLWLTILCFHCTLPFDFTQNHPRLLPVWIKFVIFAFHFILDHSGKGVILTVQKTSLCLHTNLWGLSQWREALGKAGKAAGNGQWRVLDIGNIYPGQCLCFAVIPRTLSCYMCTPPTKHSTYPWPDTLHTLPS